MTDKLVSESILLLKGEPVTDTQIVNELTRLREENARLREALQECVTDEGAVGFTGARYAKRRLRAINATVETAIKVPS